MSFIHIDTTENKLFLVLCLNNFVINPIGSYANHLKQKQYNHIKKHFVFSGMHPAVASRNITYQNGNSMNGRNAGLGHLKFSVFGLGSRAYPKFCEFGHFIDKTMETLGASRIHAVGEGDELSGQEISFRDWAKNVYQVRLLISDIVSEI